VLEGALFAALALLACGALALSTFAIARLQLMSPDAIHRDGLGIGLPAPTWALSDLGGGILRSPPDPGNAPQLLIFTDHSLKSFPSVVDGMVELKEEARSAVDIIILLKEANPIVAPISVSHLQLQESFSGF
jgi:hypothetical protein